VHRHYPLAIVVTLFMRDVSQVQFTAQWSQTAHSRTRRGDQPDTNWSGLRAREATIDEFGRQNKRLYDASFKAQFLSASSSFDAVHRNIN